jgi:hypothetical protein
MEIDSSLTDMFIIVVAVSVYFTWRQLRKPIAQQEDDGMERFCIHTEDDDGKPMIITGTRPKSDQDS